MIADGTAGIETGRVLIVDDNAANRYLLAQWLRRAGHEVVEAVDGTEALETLAGLAPDATPEVAVLDVILPDMTGFELCRRIKAAPATADMPVIHVSATAVSVADRAQGLHEGADAYLAEPVDHDELMATLTAVLRYTRARRVAQRLAGRLLRLNEATLDLYRATDFERFAVAAVSGARAVLGVEAAGVYLSVSGQPVRTYQLTGEDPVVNEPISADLLDEIAYLALGARPGAGIALVAREQWRVIVPEPRLSGDILVAAVRARADRPPVCVAVACEHDPAEDDRTLLIQIAQACALAVESLRSYAEQHALALELQRSFLPSRPPEIEGVRLAVRYVPASAQAEIGGDFYEAIETAAGLLLAIGDVVGHSLEAAILMGEVRHALRAYAIENHPPERILSLLDSVLLHGRAQLATATLCLVLVEPGSRRVHIANAGHVPPLLLTAEGDRFVTEHGRLLGLGGGVYEVTSLELTGPTRLVLCTDGLVEVRREELGKSLAGFADAVRRGPAGLEELCDALLGEFGRAKDDDIALLAADLTPGG